MRLSIIYDVHLYKFFTCLDINKICLNHIRVHLFLSLLQVTSTLLGILLNLVVTLCEAVAM